MNIIKRLQEPSTWAGLAALIAIVSPGLAESVPQIGLHIGAIVAAGAALFAIVKKDPGSDE